MAILHGDEVADLVTTTLNGLPKGDFTDNSLDLNELVAMNRLLKKGTVKFESSGTKLEFDVMVDHNHSAAMVGLGQVITPNDRDVMIKGEIPWRHMNNYFLIEERMVSMNRSPSKIVDYLKTRRIAGQISGAKKMEEQFWNKPSSSSDEENAYGVPFYVVYNATQGFNGAAPTGFTTVANINPSTYTRWKNWSANYTAIAKTDLIRKMRRGMFEIDFKPPVKDIPETKRGAHRYGIYTVYEVRSKVEELLEAQNDNLGKDVASMEGDAQIFKVPLVAVPQLKDSAVADSDPVYMLDWATFFPVFLEGEYMMEQKPIRLSLQPRTLVTHTHNTFNFKNTDRRRQAVFAKAAPFA